MLDNYKDVVNSRGQPRETPFLCTPKYGKLEIAKRSKERGANLNAEDRHGDSVLYWAKDNKNKEIINYLESLGLE